MQETMYFLGMKPCLVSLDIHLLRWLVLTIDLLEHAKHVFHVTVVQEPNLWIPVVLFIRHCAARITASSQYCKKLQSHHRQMLCA